LNVESIERLVPYKMNIDVTSIRNQQPASTKLLLKSGETVEVWESVDVIIQKLDNLSKNKYLDVINKDKH